MTTTKTRKTYSKKDVIEILGVSRDVVYSMIKNGSLKLYNNQVTEESLNEILERRKIQKPKWIKIGAAEY